MLIHSIINQNINQPESLYVATHMEVPRIATFHTLWLFYFLGVKMAWLESHQNLENHPKLSLFLHKTGFNLNEAIGFLHRLWWWTLTYAEDGILSKYDCSQFLVRLTDKIEPEKLLNFLIECNFIDDDTKNIKIHNWLKYAGRYLTGKYRTANPKKLKEIMKLYKSDLKQTKVRQKSDFSPTTLPNLPNHTLPNQKEDIYSPVSKDFEQFWLAYPRKTSKKKAFEIWQKLKPNAALINQILQTIEKQKTSIDWVKDNGQFIPYPSTYLNNRRWEDEIIQKGDNDDRFKFFKGSEKT